MEITFTIPAWLQNNYIIISISLYCAILWLYGIKEARKIYKKPIEANEMKNENIMGFILIVLTMPALAPLIFGLYFSIFIIGFAISIPLDLVYAVATIGLKNEKFVLTKEFYRSS